MKIQFIIVLALMVAGIVSCDFRPEKQRKAEKEANNFYDRVCEAVFTTNGATDGWNKIKDNYSIGRKILFLSANSDFSIIVVRNTEETMVQDSTQPVDTVTVTTPILNSLEEAMKKTQAIADKLGGIK